jgi:ABC-type uncharacterized transport system ATPase subunit
MDLTLHNNGIDRSPEPAAQKDGRSSAGSSATAVYSTASGESIIQIEHLTKIFREQKRTVTAVNDVTFDVNRGEIFGLLGPNGAGKSTIIRILTTLLKPTSGTASVDTYNISSDPDKIREIIGVCPQNSTLDV